MMKTKVSTRGFTLIELMIVVVIIGILAMVAIPKFSDILRKSKEGSTKGSLTNLRSALSIYITDNNGSSPLQNSVNPTPEELTRALVPKYITAIPMVRLGENHPDSATIRISTYSDAAQDLAASPAFDNSGWVYSNSGGGKWWISCSHKDTKGNPIYTW